MADHPSTVKEQAALRIVNRLTDKGYQALYAGGCVRDLVRTGCMAGDIDIATSAPPAVVAAAFERVVAVGEQFGVMVVVEEGIPFEVATFRSDGGYTDGRHPDSVALADAQEDARRRDFTINGMFHDPLSGRTLDFVGGRDDLRTGLIRAIGAPARRFTEDYLRLLRAVRFAARFEFTIEPLTWEALVGAAAGITAVSAERIFAELDKMLLGPHPGRAFRLLHESGLLRLVLPEVAALDGVPQPPAFHPEGDVLSHTLLALSLMDSPSQALAWSVLLHDVGKPATMTETDRVRFNNHDRAGAIQSAETLRRLRAPNALIEAVAECVGNHMAFMHVDKMRVAKLKRFLARPTIADEMELHRIDCAASHGDLGNWRFCRSKYEEFAADQLKPAPLLSGRDLIALGLKPGPLFGEILDAAYDLQLESTVTSRDQAVAWVRERYLRQG